MTEAAKEARRKYYRQWYRRNRERVQAQRERHWEQMAKEATEDEQTDGNKKC